MQTHMRIHVLSDDDHVREAAGALDSDKYTLGFSKDRKQALDAMRAGCDLAVIDLRNNGFAVARDLKAGSSTSDVRIVMLCDRAADLWLCRQAGAESVIVKPMSDPSELTAAVESVLSKVA